MEDFYMVYFKNTIANAIGSALLEFSEGKTFNCDMVEGVEITREASEVHDWAVEARADTFWVRQENGVIDAIYEGDLIEALNWAYPIVVTPEFLASYAPMYPDFPGDIIDHIAAIQEVRGRVEATPDISRALQRIGEIAEAGGKKSPSSALSALIEQVLSDDLLAAS